MDILKTAASAPTLGTEFVKNTLVSVGHDDADKLRIKINHVEPVELFDLTNCLLAVAKEYNRFSKKKFSPEYDDTQKDLKLYVHTIRPGSIEVELMLKMANSVTEQGLFAIDAANSIIEFCKHLVVLIAWVRSWKSNPDAEASPEIGEMPEKASIENAAQIVQVVNKNSPGSSMQIGNVINNIFTENVNINFGDGQIISDNAKAIVDAQANTTPSRYRKVLLVWNQVKNQIGKVETDKAIVNDISKKAVKIHYDNDGIKTLMLGEDKNFFLYGYIVDIRVSMAFDVPKLYIIEQFYEKFLLDDGEK